MVGLLCIVGKKGHVVESKLWQDIQAIRQHAPLVHNITNFVAMTSTANALLAIGASPVMAHAVEEVEEMAGIAQALVLNIGTLSDLWVTSMAKAATVAQKRGVPIILDPVGSGATKFRTNTALRLLKEYAPVIVRGNASEILSLGNEEGRTKGVDSLHSSDAAVETALHLSERYASVVCISGAVDIVVGRGYIGRIYNGDSLMSRVTGMGCTASALCGAFAAINSSAFDATVHAMAAMGIAGEIAKLRSTGPGSFQVQFLDSLYSLDEATCVSNIKVQCL